MPSPISEIPLYPDNSELSLSFLKLWSELNPNKAKNLDLKNGMERFLIPNRIFEIAKGNIKILVIEKGEGILNIMVIEQTDGIEQITDPKQWQKWQEDIKSVHEKEKGSLARIQFQPGPPEGIDRLHAKYKNMIDDGVISLNDKILMAVSLDAHSHTNGILFVGDYDGADNVGIATDFYTNTLPQFAKECGFRFIEGEHYGENIRFFKDRLGRSTYNDIKPEYREVIFPNSDPNSSNQFSTVQFLIEGDKELYTLSNEI